MIRVGRVVRMGGVGSCGDGLIGDVGAGDIGGRVVRMRGEGGGFMGMVGELREIKVILV